MVLVQPVGPFDGHDSLPVHGFPQPDVFCVGCVMKAVQVDMDQRQPSREIVHQGIGRAGYGIFRGYVEPLGKSLDEACFPASQASAEPQNDAGLQLPAKQSPEAAGLRRGMGGDDLFNSSALWYWALHGHQSGAVA